MNPVTVLIGLAALGFGIYTAYVRATNPAKLGKLEAMKKRVCRKSQIRKALSSFYRL